jgi:hypothetical protein
MPPIVAELHLKSKQRLALNISSKIAIIDEHSILAKLMVQTSRISGLAQVYDHIVGFEGNEFYFYRPDEGFGGKTYGELVFHFPTCCLLGLRTPDGEIKINPDRNAPVGAGDEALLIAEDDSAISFSPTRVPAGAVVSRPASPRPKAVERQLIIGWSQKTSTIIDEYSNYLIEGSGIDLIVADPDDAMKKEFAAIKEKHPAINMRLLKADIDNPEILPRLKPEQYDNVIILSGEGGVAELLDSDTIAILLAFRQYFRTLGDPDLIKTQLITEVADSENIDVIKEAGVKDFLISNQFVSKIYAQVSENQDVLKVYEDLFSEEGSEVYLKPVHMFLGEIPPNMPFADLCNAALDRNETCFGVHVLAEEKDKSKGYGIYINPPKSRLFTLRPDDRLITLAEDET